MTSEALPPALAVPERGLGRWSASLIAVLAAHGVVAALLLASHDPSLETIAPPPAVMIDLAPPAPPAPVVEPAKPPPPPEPVKRAVEPPAPPTPAPNPVVALPPPKPKPKPVQHVEPKPEPAPPHEARPAPPPPQVAVAPAVTAPPRPRVTPGYEGELVARLERALRYPRELRVRGIGGAPLVRFTLDRSGKVLAFSLVQSSGHRALDEEALATVRRADPLPPFPPEMTQGEHDFTVPLVFRLTP
jgi:protein TonB